MHIGRIFYIVYSARYSLFVLMCRKTHITHSLTHLGLMNQYDLMLHLKIKVGPCDLYFMDR